MPISDDPSTMISPQERPEQGKFGEAETNFLKTHLPAYGALCDTVAKKATGPRGTGSVKGCKKEWILSKVFPEFVKQFSSDQDGGPQLQSLQAVSYLLWRTFLAGMLLETIAMVCKSRTSSKCRPSINLSRKASARHQRCCNFCKRAQGKNRGAHGRATSQGGWRCTTG
jgi:hypothetical protein